MQAQKWKFINLKYEIIYIIKYNHKIIKININLKSIIKY